jgi:hypothetical protein
MKKKLILVIWIVGLIFSTGFTPAYSAPDTRGINQLLFESAGSIQVQLSVTNKSKSMAVVSIRGTEPYFSSFFYVPKGKRVTKNIKVVPGKFTVIIGFGVEGCESISKTFKIARNTKKIALSFTCGKFW